MRKMKKGTWSATSNSARCLHVESQRTVCRFDSTLETHKLIEHRGCYLSVSIEQAAHELHEASD